MEDGNNRPATQEFAAGYAEQASNPDSAVRADTALAYVDALLAELNGLRVRLRDFEIEWSATIESYISSLEQQHRPDLGKIVETRRISGDEFDDFGNTVHSAAGDFCSMFSELADVKSYIRGVCQVTDNTMTYNFPTWTWPTLPPRS